MVVIGESSVVDPKGACWVVGAGTGFGYFLCWSPKITALNMVLPGEGGHVDLSACNEIEDDIFEISTYSS